VCQDDERDVEGKVMPRIRKIQFSLRASAMFVLTSAAASALYVKILQHSGAIAAPALRVDIPSLFMLAICLTAVALGSWKEHTPVQTMLQVTLTCLGCLVLIWIGEARYDRALRYWFQGTFAATVTLPLLTRRIVKSELPKGPRRDWWKKTCEAFFFSFLNLMLVTAGGAFQAYIIESLGSGVLANPVGP
jgi:hypothetical protein